MTGPAAPRRAPLRRGGDALLGVSGALVLVLAALPVERTHVGAAEAAVFRAVNGVDALPFLLVWPFMQLGNFLVVPASALVAALLRRWRLAAGLLLAGAGTYLAAKGVKDVVVRGRPAGLLEDTVLRGAAAQGRGFVSGHAAVVAAVLTVAWPWLGRRARVAGVVLATVVCLARVWTGAHLPLDVVGGAGLGLLVGGVVLLVVGRPSPCRSRAAVLEWSGSQDPTISGSPDDQHRPASRPRHRPPAPGGGS